MRTIKDQLVNTTIETAFGNALYHHTEIEDEFGRWNNHYSFSAGEIVTHRGKEHNVYFV